MCHSYALLSVREYPFVSKHDQCANFRNTPSLRKQYLVSSAERQRRVPAHNEAAGFLLTWPIMMQLGLSTSPQYLLLQMFFGFSRKKKRSVVNHPRETQFLELRDQRPARDDIWPADSSPRAS